MAKAGLEPNSSSTRPIYLYLSSSEDLPSQAWSALKEMHEDSHEIPIAAINVVIESAISVGHLNEAIDLYKQAHSLCESGATTETFNILLGAV